MSQAKLHALWQSQLGSSWYKLLEPTLTSSKQEQKRLLLGGFISERCYNKVPGTCRLATAKVYQSLLESRRDVLSMGSGTKPTRLLFLLLLVCPVSSTLGILMHPVTHPWVYPHMPSPSHVHVSLTTQCSLGYKHTIIAEISLVILLPP
jgi:hypothetical protein